MSEPWVYVPASVSQVLDGIEGEVDRALAHRAWVAAGSKGMHVSFHGDFAGAPITTLKRIRWWTREVRRAHADDKRPAIQAVRDAIDAATRSRLRTREDLHAYFGWTT